MRSRRERGSHGTRGENARADLRGSRAGMRIDYAFWCADGVYNMDSAETTEAARMVEAAHNIPYHNDTSNAGEMFDR